MGIEELHDCSSSLNIKRVIKWRRKRWAERMSLMEETRNVYIFTVETPEGNELLGKPRGRSKDDIAIKLNAIGWKLWTDFIWLRTETSGDNDSASFTKIRGGFFIIFLDLLASLERRAAWNSFIFFKKEYVRKKTFKRRRILIKC